MDGMGGLRDTQKYPSRDHCKRGGGAVRQEKITRASSLIPNETFRYQGKSLALSKAQTKVLPLPCRLPARRRGHWSRNCSESRASLPLGAGPQQNSF